MRIENRQHLAQCREDYRKALECQYKKVLICCGSGCVASGSMNVYSRMKELLHERGLRVDVELQHEGHEESVGLKRSGCLGFCQMGPLMRIEPMGLMYTKVSVDDCEEIIEKTILGDEIIDRLLYSEEGKSYIHQEDIPFYKKQLHVTLEHCGHINAESAEEYIAEGGYTALEKALFDMTPDEIISEISESGLRGRGGAGFPTGKKWAQVAAHKDAPVKYIVCNGDEGDPGAFMDCSIMEGDPHRMIEGMIIAGIATGSEEGYIYVRAEYPLAVERLKMAIADDEAHGLLGDNILGSGKNFRLRINRGAGAFVCGEGSALTASIEGGRGMPRTKPPRSVDHGLFDAPTSLNNVETFANVPTIIERGAAWYRSIGTANSPGTKLFTVCGNVVRRGVFEFPMGVNLKDIIYEVCGGIADGKGLLGVQTGGTSGAIINADQIDMTLDIDTVSASGGRLGCGTILVIDDSNCIVDIVRNNLDFFRGESCGKCTPCREGGQQLYNLVTRISRGLATLPDLEKIDELTETMRLTALCGLGHSTAVPVQTSIQNFRKEYLAHIDRDYCPVCTQAAVAEGIYEAEEDYRNDGNSRIGIRRAAVGERDVMYDSYDAYARHRSRGASYAGRFERRGGREA